MDWTNLYKKTDGAWLKGNLHTHSGEGMTQEEILGRYTELGYDFLCISDHMKLTVPQPPRGSQLLVLTGFEWNSKTGEHMNLISFQKPLLTAATAVHEQKAVFDRLAQEQVLVILNHPNWQEPPHYSREALLERAPAALGLEIYNGLIDVLSGTSLATEKWDFLLSRGQKLLGFASDDAHRLDHIGNAWIMVRAASRTPRSVYAAIKAGNFYCSTGVTFNVLRRSRSVVEIAAADADEIWAVGEWGVRLARERSGRMVFDFDKVQSAYGNHVRFVAFGKGAAQAWTQPFFKKSPVDEKRVSPFVEAWKVSRLLPVALSQVKAGQLSDASLGWQEAQARVSPAGFVNVAKIHGKNGGVCLLSASVQVARRGTWTVCLGHDGGACLFVDGKRVIHRPALVNPAYPDRSRATVTLAAGRHDLQVALDTQGGRGQGIFLRFMIPPTVKPLPAVPVFPQSCPSGTGKRSKA
jgi:hypothetical protein